MGKTNHIFANPYNNNISIMDIKLIRYKSNDVATLGKLFLDAKFECYTLEDTYREVKIKHETRISAGVYELAFRKYGRFHNIYKTRYAQFHKGMIELLGVPNFTDILIHAGVTHEDTSGCLLTGKQVDEQKMQIVAGTSAHAYIALYIKLAAAMDSKQYIQIFDLDKRDTELTDELLNDILIKPLETV